MIRSDPHAASPTWADVDVADVVSASILAIAGVDSLDRVARRVLIVAGPVDLASVRDGDILVATTDGLVASGEAHDHLVARLVGAGAAALAISEQSTLPLPPELLEAATRHRLAVLRLARSSDVAGLATAVREALVEAREQRIERYIDADRHFAATTLEELIAGDASTAVDVTERSAGFGWDLSLPRAVLLASVDPPTPPDLVGPDLVGPDLVGPDLLEAALDTIAAAARATLGPDAIVWKRTTSIAALVAPASSASIERRELADLLRRELDRRLRSVTVSIGVGRRCEHPTDLPRSYIEASRAVDIGRWANGRHGTEVFDELGLERLLASTPRDDVADFVRHAIGPLLQHDRAHRTDLVETLGVWLETRNMAAAARQVHVHHNTLKNRLDRIESILGPVLDDPERSLVCQVAIHVMRHAEPHPSTPPFNDTATHPSGDTATDPSNDTADHTGSTST